MTDTIGFIGAGKMGFALAQSLQVAGLAPNIVVYDILDARCELFVHELTSVSIAANAAEVCRNSNTTFLAIKPQDVAKAASNINFYDRMIISIVAGVSLSQLATFMPNARIVRVMPNAPCLVGEMAAGFAMGHGTDDSDRKTVNRLLTAAGVAFEVPEKQIDIITGLSGSGPAYFARFIEWFSMAGEQLGLDPQVATALTVQTALGTARLIQQRSITPGDLVDMVSSPGGTTVAGRRILESGAVRKAIERTVATATARSRELGEM